MGLQRHFMLLAFGVAAGLATLLGGGLALRLGERLHLVLGASAGAVLGVALFGLFPESLELGAHVFGARGTILALSLGFIGYMILERATGAGAGLPGGTKHLGPASLILHSALDGVGIGFAFQISSVTGGAVALAVLAHDVSDGINTVTLSAGPDTAPGRAARYWLYANALAPLSGIVASSLVRIDAQTLALVLSGFAGAFLYIGAVELLPRSYRRSPRPWTTGTTIAGMSAMYLVTSLAR